MAVAIALVLMLVLMFIRVPVFVALGLGSLIAFVSLHQPLSIVSEKIYAGLNSFPLMAVPYFLLAAGVLQHGGIGTRVVRLAQALVGAAPAGLALASLLSCAFFAALSGSSLATMASIGSVAVPEMVEAGYSQRFAIGAIAAGGTLGMLLPPSIPIILYAFTTNTSVLALFIAGLFPALILLALLMGASLVAWRTGWMGTGTPQALSSAERRQRIKTGIPLIAYPIALAVGIYGIPRVTKAVVTPTEAALFSIVIAIIFAFFVYRAMSWRKLPGVLASAMESIGLIMAIIAGASLFGFVVAASGVSNSLGSWVDGLHIGKIGLLLLYNLLLLLVGDYLEAAPIILIIVPIFFPIAVAAGIDPIQFGIITVVNIEIGCITPPVGINLLMASSITDIPLYQVMKAALPWILVVLVALVIVTLVPQVSLWLPNALGYS